MSQTLKTHSCVRELERNCECMCVIMHMWEKRKKKNNLNIWYYRARAPHWQQQNTPGLWRVCICCFVCIRFNLLVSYWLQADFFNLFFLLAVRPRLGSCWNFRPEQHSKVNILFTEMMKQNCTGMGWTWQTVRLSTKLNHSLTTSTTKIDIILLFVNFSSLSLKIPLSRIGLGLSPEQSE